MAHLIHTFTSIPVKESLPPEHGCELLWDTLEHLLDGCGVSNEGCWHLETLGWDVTDTGLHIVGDPLDKVRAVLVLDVQHLLIYLQEHRDSEHGTNCQKWMHGQKKGEASTRPKKYEDEHRFDCISSWHWCHTQFILNLEQKTLFLLQGRLAVWGSGFHVWICRLVALY